MTRLPDPPKMYNEFMEKFPALGDAWQRTSEAGRTGSLDARTMQLLKIAIAAGSMRQGAVHSGVRKAVALGISREEIEQIIPIVAGTMGFPTAVAIWSWMRDELDASTKK